MPAHILDRSAAVYVAGHGGLVGSAITRRLGDAGFSRILGARYLLSGPLEPTNEPYAIAKISGIDTSKPDGAPRKVLDVSRLHNLGWRHRISLREGLESTYEWFRTHQDTARLTGRQAC